MSRLRHRRNGAAWLIVVAALIGSILSSSPAVGRADPSICDDRDVEDSSTSRSFSWSPDGRRSAKIDRATSTVVLRDGRGGLIAEVRLDATLTSQGDRAGWSTHGAAFTVATEAGWYIVDRDGRAEGPFAGAARLSPDEARVAFVDDRAGLSVRDRQSGSLLELPVVGDESVWSVEDHSWSFDGEWLLFSARSSLLDGDLGVYRVARDGSTVELVAGPPAVQPRWVGIDGSIAWNDPDAQGFVVRSADGATQLFRGPDDSWVWRLADSTQDGRLLAIEAVEVGEVLHFVLADRWSGDVRYQLPDVVLTSLASDGTVSVEPAPFGPYGVFDPDGTERVDERGDGRIFFRPCPGFGDLRHDSFALRDVAVIAELGITTGTSLLTYSPGGQVTREQMAAFLARLWEALGNTCGGTPGEFIDVPVTSFAYEAVACIKDLGVTNGTGNGTYSPSAFVTREQMAAFLARMWEALGNTCGGTPGEFTDVPVTSFAYEAVACIKDLGITNGVSPTTYGPAQFVTREQIAAFIARFWRAA
ncbi:MAG: S-layer homology domain-containing protein [Actinomycetota bacterium]